jgi:hypothetical protein
LYVEVGFKLLTMHKLQDTGKKYSNLPLS